MDFYVVLERPGFRVARRRQKQGRVGVQHRVTKEDAIKWCSPSAPMAMLPYCNARQPWPPLTLGVVVPWQVPDQVRGHSCEQGGLDTPSTWRSVTHL